uniref:RING-type domain-containing protein n=1 Tax=viral metagenome TaxID=1070528 RepID=A0A6C0JZQ2_9ZZZZ
MKNMFNDSSDTLRIHVTDSHTEIECCVCYSNYGGRTTQFYNCINIGYHYICNYCYNEWSNHSSVCPMCRSNQHDIIP